MGHLGDVGLSYVSHMKGAFSLAGSCLYAACVLFMHGVFPNLGGTTGTDTLKTALKKLEENNE
jgi:hypothetical protein